jgi:type IV pilus assembly protein PilP
VNGQPSLGVQSLRIGDYLGKNFGRVQQMTDNAIAIKELQQDTSGAWSENEISLQLLADNL